MLYLRFLAVLFVLGGVSCGPVVQTSLAPVTNSAGGGVVLKPSKFSINKNTRKSDVIRLGEDIVKAMPGNFPSNLIPLDPDKGEVVQGSILLLPTQVKEKGRSSTTGVVMPIVGVKYFNVPQERIDSAMPSIQRAYYKQLSQHGRLIPMSRLEDAPR